MSVLDIFAHCSAAVEKGVLIERANRSDKEFHFQDWFGKRLEDLDINYDPPARNSYPDYRLVASPIGFELKGLEFPGRVPTFDCNSQLPAGFHNGRSIYYVFGRYPKSTENKYPVVDLVICHGDLLNAQRDYKHQNKSFKEFGSYGDIMVRDRKMYVAPTPFGLLDGLDRQITLIVTEDVPVDNRFRLVGEFERVEANELVTKYTFDFDTNNIAKTLRKNPNAGKRHKFRAYRLKKSPETKVTLKDPQVKKTKKKKKTK